VTDTDLIQGIQAELAFIEASLAQHNLLEGEDQ
jgi:hypothetical protein